MVTSTGVPVQPYFQVDLIQVLKFIFRKWFFKMGLKITKNGSKMTTVYKLVYSILPVTVME